MQIFVRTLAGTTSTVDIEGSDTVQVVKGKIAARIGLAAAEFDVSFGGKVLGDAQPIENFSVQKNCTLQLVARLKGGMTW